MMPDPWSSASAPPGSLPHQQATYAYSSNPAFIPVQVRQGFGQYSPVPNASPYASYSPPQPTVPAQVTHSAVHNGASPAPASEPPKQQKVDWPPSVREYVQRSFMPTNMDSTVSRAEIEAKLKETISQAKDSGRLWEINWAEMPLPQALVKTEREMALRGGPLGIISPEPRRGFASVTEPIPSKKRKSSDLADHERSSPAPPWRSTNNNRPASLEDRITFSSPDKRTQTDEPPPKLSKFQKQLEKRQRRFDGGYKSSYRSPSPPPTAGPVVGTSTVLEKKYLRLTAPPVASQVRPEHVLRQTLDLLKKKWKRESNYSYICDQLKSMRQDLTVQHIKNEFTVSVYELHARIALEKGDLGEYNQCQTQLRTLYALGLDGNPIEFKAYRILYFIHTANRSGLNDALADLTAAEKEEYPIKHALNVRSALALGNYHKFFRLYLDTPNMGAYLMDMFVSRERLAALCNLCKAYKPDVKLRFITEELGFESDADAAQFIVDYNGQALLEDRKDQGIAFLTGKAGSIFDAARSEAFRKVDIKGQI